MAPSLQIPHPDFSKRRKQKADLRGGPDAVSVLPKLMGLTDTGITVAPDFGAKMAIIKNAADLFSRLVMKARRWGSSLPGGA